MLPTDRSGLLLGAAVVGVPAAIWYLIKGTKTAADTDFESYLRNVETTSSTADVFSDTSFEAYLKTNNALQQPTLSSSQSTLESGGAASSMPSDRAPVTVIFGTEYGFSKEIAEKLADKLKQTAIYWPRVIDMADHPEGVPLDQHQAVLVVCSTQGDGVPPGEAREFCDWLQSCQAPKLSSTHFSVCALGDRSYQHFCRCGKTLDSRLETLGASRLYERADINREDWKAIDTWIEGALAALAGLSLKTAAELGEDEAGAGAAPVAGRRWSKGRPFMGAIKALEGLCHISSADDKNTYRVEVDLGDSGLEYTPGDALGVWPLNCPQAVEELLGVLGADGGLLVQVPAWHYADPEVGDRTTMTLRAALSKCFDLRSPKHDLLVSLHQKLTSLKCGSLPLSPTAANGDAKTPATNGTKRSNGGGGGSANGGSDQENGGLAAEHVPNGGGLQCGCGEGCLVDALERLSSLLFDAAATEAYLEPRHVVDVLLDCAPARLAVGELLQLLRPLQPRLYSISSSQLEDAHSVQATVAVVRYSSLDKDRIGVASTYMAERLEVGQKLPIYIHKNPDFRLPPSHDTPIIMVGPGTGLAPFRSFMQERILGTASEQGGAPPSAAPFGESVLYFGCRRRDQDFLYGPLLEQWASEGKLKLFTAFSRQQAHKVYVQDRLLESSSLVWRLLEAGGHFYVCGDAASMAGSVERALLQIIQQEGGRDPASAQQYLDQLSQQGRYQRDVWF